MASPAGVALIDTFVMVADILGQTLKVVMDILTPFMPLIEFVLKVLQLILGLLQKGIESIGLWIGEFGKLEWVKGMLKPIMDGMAWLVGIINDALRNMGLLKDEGADTSTSVADQTAAAQAARDKALADYEAKRDAAIKAKRQKALEAAKAAAKAMREHLEESAKALMAVGEKFKNALDLSFGFDDAGGFSVDKFMEQTRKIVDAARKLPNQLKKLRTQGASDEVIANILAQGPEKGSAIAAGFLSQGGVKGYSDALTSLETSGRQAGAVAASTNTYQININKANMTAEEIIAAIQKYERKTGKKVVFGG
jgi:multidrug efflux pump subunit AcrA (membrane-fusion protein)